MRELRPISTKACANRLHSPTGHRSPKPKPRELFSQTFFLTYYGRNSPFFYFNKQRTFHLTKTLSRVELCR